MNSHSNSEDKKQIWTGQEKRPDGEDFFEQFHDEGRSWPKNVAPAPPPPQDPQQPSSPPQSEKTDQ